MVEPASPWMPLQVDKGRNTLTTKSPMARYVTTLLGRSRCVQAFVLPNGFYAALKMSAMARTTK